MNFPRTPIVWLALCFAPTAVHAEFALRDGDTVVFLGDSITAARGYTKIVEHYTLMRFPERKVRFVNAGQGGDTASGSLQRLERDVFSKGATLVTVASVPRRRFRPPDQAFARLPLYDWSSSREALNVIEKAIIATHGDSTRRQELENRLAAILATAAPRAPKDFVCRQLSIIGTARSVPTLAPLLLDADLSHMARFAFERIPGSASAAALREALPKARGQTKAGIINSLGMRADPHAAGALTKLLVDPDLSIAGAAASALGKIGTPDAARALEQFRATAPQTLQALVNQAYVQAAENLVRRGQRAQAVRIFQQLYTDEEYPFLRLSGFQGLLSDEPESKPAIGLLARALSGDDEPLRSLAVRIIADSPAEHVPKTLLDLLPSLPSKGQVGLLHAIHAKADALSRPAVVAACDSREPNVRLAALRALTSVGNPEDVLRLARLAATGTGDENAAARRALANLPGREPSTAMLALLPEAQPPIRIELIKALATRFATEAAPALADQLKDPDHSVRRAALEALAALGDEKQAPAVVAFLKSASENADRRNAEEALDAIVTRAGPNSREVLISGLKDAALPSRIILLQQLGRLGGPQALNDFREVLARPDIDAVYVATPDHWHALVTIAAARAGKHVYCQKPLTRTIAEGQAVVRAVRRHNIVFQHGTQQRYDPKMLFGCELVRNGYIGQLQHVKIGSPQGQVCGPQPVEPVPEGLDWQMWLGPAPWAPFTSRRIRSHDWYFISDYCMGYIAGWGVHHADSAQQASGLDHPTGLIEVDARGEFAQDGLFDNPHRWNMNYRFTNGVTWNWTDTPAWEPLENWSDPVRHRMGIRLEGTEGWVFIWRGMVDAYPKSLLKIRIGPHDRVRLVQPGGEPIPDFIDCVRRHERTCAPVEIAHRSTTLCSLGAISMLLQRKIVWDPVKEQFVKDDEAVRLKSRAMREPWTL